MDLPLHLVEHIGSFLDSSGKANLSATCKEYKSFSHTAKRQVRREEFIQCANRIKFITHCKTSGDFNMMGGMYDTREMLTVAYLWQHTLPEYYRYIDPEKYDILCNNYIDNIPYVWSFCKNVCEVTL